MTKEELKAYLDRKDITIENNIAKWDIKTIGDINGLYTGSFKFKCYLTPTEKLAAGRDYRDMLGGNSSMILKHEDNLAFTLSQLKYRIVSGPPFWSSSVGVNGIAGDIPDEKVLDVIFEASIAAEFKYLAQLQDKKDRVIEKAKKVAENIIENKKEEDDDENQEEA